MAGLIELQFSIYAVARAMFARGELAWPLIDVEAYLVGEDYIADLEAETSLDRVVPTFSQVPVLGKEVDDFGYCYADGFVFPGAVLTSPANQVVLASQSVPLFHGMFPPIAISEVPTNIPVLFSEPWMFRL